ncbi:MAG: hypothetical protein U1G07_18695 [Verrucomicrobiota bacterium]
MPYHWRWPVGGLTGHSFRVNPKPPGSMVVVAVEPNFRAMDRAGLSTGTRRVALQLWGGALPDRPLTSFMQELYRAENAGKAEAGGSQDMAGLIHPRHQSSGLRLGQKRRRIPGPHRVHP